MIVAVWKGLKVISALQKGLLEHTQSSSISCQIKKSELLSTLKYLFSCFCVFFWHQYEFKHIQVWCSKYSEHVNEFFISTLLFCVLLVPCSLRFEDGSAFHPTRAEFLLKKNVDECCTTAAQRMTITVTDRN